MGKKRRTGMNREQMKLSAVIIFFLLSGIFYGGKFGFSAEGFSMGEERDAQTLGNWAGETVPGEELLERLNINSADGDELERLPAIGEKTAQAILAYRAENGAFQETVDIMDVPGIGEKTFEKIKDYITVE